MARLGRSFPAQRRYLRRTPAPVAATANGTLTLIGVAGGAVPGTANGTLTLTGTALALIPFSVPPDGRLVAVSAESRGAVVDSEVRQFAVAGEQRTRIPVTA